MGKEGKFCLSQLGSTSVTVLRARGIDNPAHAGDIIADSKATGKRPVSNHHHMIHVCLDVPCLFCTALHCINQVADSQLYQLTCLIAHISISIITFCNSHVTMTDVLHCSCKTG